MWWRRNRPVLLSQVECIFYFIMLNFPLTSSALSHCLTHWLNKCCDLNMLTDTGMLIAYSNTEQGDAKQPNTMWEEPLWFCLSSLCVFRPRPLAQLLSGVEVGAFSSLLGRQKVKALYWKWNWHHLSPQASLQEAHYWKYLSFLELKDYFFLFDFS